MNEGMKVDKTYCMSSFLMYRTIIGHDRKFSENTTPRFYEAAGSLEPIRDSEELEHSLRRSVEQACQGGRAAIALSGGIDSAVLARFMPRGSVAYTFKCVVPGKEVTDETSQAARYAELCGLEHRVVEIYWEDFEQYAPVLMRHKGAPIHSIEVQIYKGALQALADGMDTFIFGETADLNYGGLSGLHSKDWTFGEFIDRYAYVKPYHVLKEYEMVTEPLRTLEKNGMIDVHEFCRGLFLQEAMGSYTNACQCAGIKLSTPYAQTRLSTPLDIERIRRGESKYLVREVFNRLYPGLEVPPKTPMPRPMNEWLSGWDGPVRKEFWPNCMINMNGDQRWLVWALEKFLNLLEE